MGTLVNTTEYIEYGILIAIALSALELFAIASVSGGKRLNPLSYIVAVALCALLSFQMSRLVGACCVSDTVSDVQSVVGLFSKDAADMVGAIAQVSTKQIGWFIFRRCLWSALFMGAAGFLMYITMEKPSRRSGDMPRGARTGRRYTSSSPRRRR